MTTRGQRRSIDKPADPAFSLLIAAGISLLVHVAVAFSMYNRPLGRVDPKLLDQPEVFRVRRAENDLITTDDSREFSTTREREPSEPALTDLGKALLRQAESEANELAPAPAPAAHRLVDDRRPVSGDELIATVPSFQLPAFAFQEVTGRPRLEIAIGSNQRSADDRGRAPKTDDAERPASAKAPNPQALLAEAGFKLGVTPEPPVLRRPKLFESGPSADTRLLKKLPQPPPIDFAQIALTGTRRLRVPEKLDHDFDYQVSVHQAPEQRDSGAGYFRVQITGQRSLKKLRTMSKDVVFLIDTSSSVPQKWINAAVDGVRHALGSFNTGDRFNIVLFNERPAFLHPDQIQPFNSQTLADAQAFLRVVRSTGLTDVNSALSRLLVRDVTGERVYNLVLVSDGRPTRGVMDTRELINLITRDNDLSASIYCVGVGARQNRELLTYLAYRNRGFCLFVNNRHHVAAAVRDLLGRLRFPIIKDVSVSVAGLDNQEIYPRDLPDIHQGETFSIFGRFEHASEFTMRLIGSNASQPYDVTFTRNLKMAPRGDKTTAKEWARWKMYDLYSEMLREGGNDQIQEQIDQLRKQYRLRSIY